MNSMTENLQKKQTSPTRHIFTLLIFYIISLSYVHTVAAGNATVGWDRNQEPNIAGYKVYWGTATRNYSNSATVYYYAKQPAGMSYVVNDLQDGKTYYFAVTALDMAGRESDFSDEVIKKIPASTSEDGWNHWYETQNFLQIGHWQVTNSWRTIYLSQNRTFQRPIIIVSPPSYNEIDPCIIRIRNVTPESFEIKIQEWLYLDQQHATEEISFMVLEAGKHVLPDGTVWQAGTYTLSGNLQGKGIEFPEPFVNVPLVFNCGQTCNGSDPFTIRMKNPTQKGFRAAIQLEENRNDGHTTETIGYVAIEPAGALNIEKIICDYHPVTLNNIPARPEIFIQEEQSKDWEMWHLYEETGILIINDEIFADIQTFSDRDTATLRLMW